MQQAITPEVTLRETHDTGSLGGKYTMDKKNETIEQGDAVTNTSDESF